MIAFPQEGTWRWHGAGEWTTAQPAPALAVADSWLLDEGRVRAIDAHWRRFASGCVAAGLDSSAVVPFRRAVEQALPASGRWFPRVELRRFDAERAFALTLRRAPQQRSAIVAWVLDRPDPRTQPRRKGPDLGVLRCCRHDAARHGADEAVLLDSHGHLLEGAFSSLLWWEGDALCAVPDQAAILPGITRDLLLELARCEGVEVRRALVSCDALDRRETWLTSALHGIRAVTAWRGVPVRAGARHRAASWQGRLNALARPLYMPGRQQMTAGGPTGAGFATSYDGGTEYRTTFC